MGAKAVSRVGSVAGLEGLDEIRGIIKSAKNAKSKSASGWCTQVTGSISPKGWCVAYSKGDNSKQKM